ncbi:hypothetical protein MKQ68_21825 [Chitinophaga horti]|uniref:N-sulphoglucosamine sulphohydrolase C-terminal domain-containing protein n=1 Tax=Chitinophaga horti TaxID=2920382 RepID=A0ABY6IZA6_9BACT|nr:hypothetical protein [Chitinophaga horti]UYQ92721.1 hypothetical protein MKQ68_21825 [Chitinophaga horti]
MVSTGDNWKLIWYKVNGRETKQLFNLETDPDELHDLSSKSAFFGKAQQFANMLEKHLLQINDRFTEK